VVEKPDSPRKFGISMLIIAWLMIFVLLGLFFKEVLDQQTNPNTEPLSHVNQQLAEVVLLPNRQHHYVATGIVNQQTVTFLLDTGATDVVVPESLARRLGLKKGAMQFATTANGTVAVYNTIIDQLAIGDIELQQLRASINPAMEGEVILLGMSALKQVEFTQNSGTLILRQQR
jgi:aspartyl protease family protein